MLNGCTLCLSEIFQIHDMLTFIAWPFGIKEKSLLVALLREMGRHRLLIQ